MKIEKEKIIIYVVLLIILVACSFLAFNYFTKDTNNDSNNVKEKLKGTFKDKMPRVDASLATQPLMNALAKYFGGDEAERVVEENYTNTHPGYVKLINGETDLIIVTEPSAEELSLAKEKQVELEVTKVVNEGFVFFVNSKNKVDGMSLEDITNIYSGKINNWDEVGGSKSKIIPYQRPTNSGSQTGMLSLVMKNVPLRKPTEKEMIDSMGGIIDAVADYDNNVDGLGYSYYYYASVMYGTSNIKFLKINGIEPNYETIQREEYPLMTAYYIVTRKGDKKPQELKNAILSNEGKVIAKEAGYVPTK